MAQVTDSDLKEIKQLIADLAKTQSTKFDQLNEQVNNIKVDVATLKEGQNSINKRLDDLQVSTNKRFDDIQLNTNKRFDDIQANIGKRLDNLDFIARTVIGGVVLALVVGIGKFLYPNLLG